MYDLAIIGGGINGAGIARDASARGLKVILLEKNNIASGASSKSSKLIHGGLRYLEQFDFRLVKEALSERSLLLKNAPDLVHKLPFVVPIYNDSPRPLWMIKLGLHLYDWMAPDDFPKHKNLTSEEIEKLFPHLLNRGLRGGCLYYDAQMDDASLVEANVDTASSLGAEIHEHAQVIGFDVEDGKIQGVRYRDTSTGQEHSIKAKSIVNATGAWSNQVLALDPSPSRVKVYPTKGVHIVVPQINATHALLLTSPRDGRVFFVIPWKGQSLIGTTDTPFLGNPDDVSVNEEDIHYLLSSTAYYFAGERLERKDVIDSFAGLRPLVQENHQAASKISRDYVIHTSPAGLITLLGGKYTTYRLMAESVVDEVCLRLGRKVPCTTRQEMLSKSKAHC